MMPTNPTGAENAQVQDDADRKAQDELRRAIANLFRKFVIDDDMLYKVDEALREAEQRGMMRATEIARKHKGSAAKKRLERGQRLSKISDDGLVVEITAEERGEDIAADIIAQAIERAAKED